MENKIGEIVTLPDGRKAEVVEDLAGAGCNKCFLESKECWQFKCRFFERTDVKSIIYKEIKED